MNCKYDIDIDMETVLTNLSRLQSQIFKLLPMHEEKLDCIKPLETISIELLGMYKLFSQREDILALICKLEGLQDYLDEENFHLYRRTIFECCGLVDKIKTQL